MALLSSRLTSADDSPTSLIISEVACRPEAESASAEWIEFYNPAESPLSLDGWTLYVGETAEPLSGVVPGQGFFLVVASQAVADQYASCPTYVSPDGYLGSGLSDLGTGVRLTYREAGSELELLGDGMSYGADYTSCSGIAVPALGLSLHRASLAAAAGCDYVEGNPSPCGGPPPPSPPPPTATATPLPTPTVAARAVLVSEVAYRGDCAAEWIELYNASPATVDLSGWALRDNVRASAIGLVLLPGESAVVHGSTGSVISRCGAVICALGMQCIGNGLADSGDSVTLLDDSGRVIDAMAYGDGADVPLAATGLSLARYANTDGSLGGWSASEPDPGCLQRQPTATPTATASVPETATAVPTSAPAPEATTSPQGETTHVTFLPLTWQREGMLQPPALLISEVLVDGTAAGEGDEFVELRNYTEAPISLDGVRIGDAEVVGDGEAMYVFPPGASLPPQSITVIARCATAFTERFGMTPDYEFLSGSCLDTLIVPDLSRAAGWGSSPFSLANTGDEVLLLAADGSLIDSVAFGNGSFEAAGLEGDARASQPLSLQRVAGLDSDDMSLDFAAEAPSPGAGLDLPTAPAAPPAVGWGGRYCYWGNLHAHTSASDGRGPAELAFARARAAGLHFYAITDHSHWLRSVEWRRTVSAASDATLSGAFVALAGLEWSSSSQGHVNVIGGYELVSHTDAATDDLSKLYRWLEERPDVVAQFNHPGLGSSYGGSRPAGESPVVRLQEVGNGVNVTLYEQELLLSWANGWHVAPTIGSDTESTSWGTDVRARTGVWASSLDAAALMDALRQGRVFATTDSDMALAWRCGDTWMGGDLALAGADSCVLYYRDYDSEAAAVQALDFSGAVLYQWQVASGSEQAFVWPGGSSAAWLKATQGDGDVAWAAPIWASDLAR